MRKLSSYVEKVKQLQEQHITSRSTFSLGLGILYAATFAKSKSIVIGAPLAALKCLQIPLYRSLHKVVRIPLEQAKVFLFGEYIAV